MLIQLDPHTIIRTEDITAANRYTEKYVNRVSIHVKTDDKLYIISNEDAEPLWDRLQRLADFKTIIIGDLLEDCHA